MPILDIFSIRKKMATEKSDVYVYDKIPEQLRVQIINIWWEAIGRSDRDHDYDGKIRNAYEMMVRMLRKEYGVFCLIPKNTESYDGDFAIKELMDFFLNCDQIDKILDVIELSSRIIENLVSRFDYRHKHESQEIASSAIVELNQRMNFHGVGYHYVDGTLIRVDSQLVHREVILPALTVLRTKGFESAESEFLSAHAHYRSGKNAEALIDCYKAFESTMKIVCTRKKWKFDTSKSASHLIDVCITNGLIPAYWLTHFGGLRSVLESGIPTPRNKSSGHGAGSSAPHNPPPELAAYVIHMTAATILFLTDSARNSP